MLIIRGVNLYPSAVEHVLLSIKGVAGYYQLIVQRPGTMDELTLECEPTGERDAGRCEPRSKARCARRRG